MYGCRVYRVFFLLIFLTATPCQSSSFDTTATGDASQHDHSYDSSHSGRAIASGRGVLKGYKGIYIQPKLPKLVLTTDAEYVANLVNVNMWLSMCNSTVCYMGRPMHHYIFLIDMAGYDRLKFSETCTRPLPQMNLWVRRWSLASSPNYLQIIKL